MLYRVVLIILSFVVIVACSTLESQQRTIYSSSIEPDNSISSREGYSDTVLRVATLNLAHGRKDSLNQLLLWTSTIKENLNDIADVLGQHKPHVVALQEADAASFWSGSFDHVEYLASNAHYPCLIGWADFLIYCRK